MKFYCFVVVLSFLSKASSLVPGSLVSSGNSTCFRKKCLKPGSKVYRPASCGSNFGINCHPIKSQFFIAPPVFAPAVRSNGRFGLHQEFAEGFAQNTGHNPSGSAFLVDSESPLPTHRISQDSTALTALKTQPSLREDGIFAKASPGCAESAHKCVAGPTSASGHTQGDPGRCCRLRPVKDYGGALHRLVSKFDLSGALEAARGTLCAAKRGLGRLLYPPGAQPALVRYINLKSLERLSLSLSAAIASNVKPCAQPAEPAATDPLTALRAKISAAKLTSLFLTTVIKDVVSRFLSSYWLKVARVSDSPAAYRVLSTLAFGFFALGDLFVNLLGVEPKAVLSTVNHVFKQLALLTHCSVNQHVYAALSAPAADPKFNPDLNNFAFDVLGMSLGLLASHLLNKSSSAALKAGAVVSNLAVGTALSAWLASAY